MKCNDREKLFLYVHQMLQSDEAEVVRRHLAECADCSRVANEHRRLDAALDDWSAAKPSPWFDAKVRARIAAGGQKKRGLFGFGRVRVLAAGVAAVALIVALVVVFSHRGVVENQQRVAVTASPQQPATSAAARRPLPAEEQLRMDENLRVLEDYEVVANFDALSELPQANDD
jgi:anti-sigma factor RsiW